MRAAGLRFLTLRSFAMPLAVGGVRRHTQAGQEHVKPGRRWRLALQRRNAQRRSALSSITLHFCCSYQVTAPKQAALTRIRMWLGVSFDFDYDLS